MCTGGVFEAGWRAEKRRRAQGNTAGQTDTVSTTAMLAPNEHYCQQAQQHERREARVMRQG